MVKFLRAEDVTIFSKHDVLAPHFGTGFMQVDCCDI